MLINYSFLKTIRFEKLNRDDDDFARFDLVGLNDRFRIRRGATSF